MKECEGHFIDGNYYWIPSGKEIGWYCVYCDTLIKQVRPDFDRKFLREKVEGTLDDLVTYHIIHIDECVCLEELIIWTIMRCRFFDMYDQNTIVRELMGCPVLFRYSVACREKSISLSGGVLLCV